MRDIDILLKDILCLMKNSDYNDVNRRDKKRAQGGFKMIRTGDVRMNDEGMKDLYVMMLSLQSLQNRGITIKETFHRSVRTLLLWYQQLQKHGIFGSALLMCRRMLIWDLPLMTGRYSQGNPGENREEKRGFYPQRISDRKEDSPE